MPLLMRAFRLGALKPGLMLIMDHVRGVVPARGSMDDGTKHAIVQWVTLGAELLEATGAVRAVLRALSALSCFVIANPIALGLGAISVAVVSLVSLSP
jgi:hypothetical protein